MNSGQNDHIVSSFDADLSKLDNMIAEMGGLAESQLRRSIEALCRRDTTAADRIVPADKRIDDLEEEIYEFTVKLLALRQPMADDLRIVISAIKISSVIERIGDYAKNISKRTVGLDKSPSLTGALNTLSRMGNLVQSMIKHTLDAYIERDADKAGDVRERDREVDLLHTSLFRELLTYMMEDPRFITPCTHLLFVAKNIERIGDHTTSIAEQVHFMVHGQMPTDERPKDDHSSTTVVNPDDINNGQGTAEK
ncbi:MAG: phosphate signaling complex protein PhoU [Pseudomonadota bacterium]|nr:phosphate signaling complex protein PhoU [Pseudomonadota bacterium]